MPSEQQRLQFGPIRNSEFLSNHWLENRLPLEPEWSQFRKDAVAALDRLGNLWRTQRDRVERYGDEAGLEQAFIQPVLEALGWRFKYQTYLRRREPDYALFLDDEGLNAALKAGRLSPHFWDYPTVVADAKAWHVSLDRPRLVDNQREYPPEQIEWYLNNSQLDFGILTNGRLWRLTPREKSRYQPRFETHLECELPKILDAWLDNNGRGRQATFDHQQAVINDFLTFYLLFGRPGFVSLDGRDPLIRRAIRGSSEYRLGVGEGLKERVFEALRLAIQGFVSLSANQVDPVTELSLCRDQSFTLLYRLLFIMYAEDRLLLPFPANRLYAGNHSLRRHRDEIASRLDRIDRGREDDFSPDSTARWDDLHDLFDLINKGSRRYNVPAYNGGLFDPDEHPFLEEKALSDWSVARVVDQLSRAPDPEHSDRGLFLVDYRDLAIQHLGSIYEGLLELRPHFAEEPMVVIRRSGRSSIEERTIRQTETDPRGFHRTSIVYQPGDVYLLTDKGERRASGSYYTPDHIVNYIVEHTLGPLCGSIDRNLQTQIDTTRHRLARSRGRNREAVQRQLDALTSDFDDRVLSLQILDPAMGSGHFLLRACQYLAEEIATHPHTGDKRAGALEADETTMTFWKRRIVEHCLYGVDLNPMAVELAKLALWLETVAVGQPLTFLDHHLACGNSLVGAWIAELGVLPGAEPLPSNAYRQQVEQRLPVLLEPLRQIAATPSEAALQVKEKERLYRNVFDRVRRPLLRIAQVWCSVFFTPTDEQVDVRQYQEIIEALSNDRKMRTIQRQSWFESAVRVAQAADVAAFNWELEFPEVFFDAHGRRAEAGFDAVIGNPPYDVLSEKEIGRDLSAFRAFIKSNPGYAASICGKNNLYKLFICRAVELLAEGGRLGFITPMALLGDAQAADIRRLLLQRGAFTSIEAFPQKDDPSRRVFPEAKLSTAVFTFVKSDDDRVKAQSFTSRVHSGRLIEPDSPALPLSSADIPLYDPSNITIVSCSQDDWDLAVRIIRSGRMKRLAGFAQSFQGEVNETNDRKAGHISYYTDDGPEAVRGAHVCLYAVREASQGTPVYVKVDQYLDGKRADSKAFHHRLARVGFQRKSPQNNFRRLIATLIPKGTFLVESVSYVPEHECLVDLEVVLAILNSRLADWYFRLGSTNAMVGEYQVKNLPCPEFATTQPTDRKMLKDAMVAIRAADLEQTFDRLKPGLDQPPFSPAVRDVITELVKRIIRIEVGRGDIARTDRSRLAAEAQPYQDLIDRLLYAMAGLNDDEVRGLEERLEQML